MENAVRSENTRKAVIKAALTIIARDGARRLTLDAIARECGISKGGLMHQFHNKEAVLKALLEHQISYFDAFSTQFRQETGASPESNLTAQIATMREATERPNSVAFALLAILAEEPGLVTPIREINAQQIAEIKAEAADPDLALLRWVAARGLLLGTLLGLDAFTPDEQARLFDRLLDSSRWTAHARPASPPAP
ncbi:MAG: TetR/AcrR family transcriptional regulator [Rhizomicrobium sp.]